MLEGHLVRHRRLRALRHAPAGRPALYWEGSNRRDRAGQQSVAPLVRPLPTTHLRGLQSDRDGRCHHRAVCRLSYQWNSDKTHLTTVCLRPSINQLRFRPDRKRGRETTGSPINLRETAGERGTIARNPSGRRPARRPRSQDTTINSEQKRSRGNGRTAYHDRTGTDLSGR
jgi:hypothetical protein